MDKLVFFLMIFLYSAPAFAEYNDWRWDSEIPKHFFIFCPPETVHDPVKIDAAFKKLHCPIKFKKVVEIIGRADHFSPQIIYSLKKGKEPRSKGDDLSRTYRYVLNDGGEVHIWVLPGDLVGTAIRFEKNGKAHLLYK